MTRGIKREAGSGKREASLHAPRFTLHANFAEGKVPQISIVMSVYNTEKYLTSAIQSILDQTFTDYEFIIIDDGSTDRSADIIRGYDDPRIRLVQQTNHGLVYSFNRGVSLARGEFIA